MMRALRPNQIEALGGSRSSDNRQSPGPCYLDGSEANAAARAVDEDRLARLNSRAIVQRTKGGDVRHTDARTLCKREAIGKRMHLMRLAQHAFRVRAVTLVGRRAADIDMSARRKAGVLAAGGFDHAGGVGAWSVGQRGACRVVA